MIMMADDFVKSKGKNKERKPQDSFLKLIHALWRSIEYRISYYSSLIESSALNFFFPISTIVSPNNRIIFFHSCWVATNENTAVSQYKKRKKERKKIFIKFSHLLNNNKSTDVSSKPYTNTLTILSFFMIFHIFHSIVINKTKKRKLCAQLFFFLMWGYGDEKTKRRKNTNKRKLWEMENPCSIVSYFVST